MIDAHQHFWLLDRGDYAWPNPDVAPIFRDFAPEDLRPLLAAAAVERTVLVQATDSLAETRFLLDIARRTDFVAGVVGWVDIAAPDARAAIDELRQDAALKGLRPMLQSIAEVGWILRPEVQPTLRHMARTGLRLDALIQPRHQPVILELAQLHPDLPIVIDHIAKPRIGKGRAPDAAWREGMAALAGCANVCVKLSGMVTEAGADWSEADLAPFAAHVLAAFGPARVMWGSDWPVVNLDADYGRWIEAAQALTSGLSQADRAQIFGGTARRFYGIAP
ncbi:amidohydrolase family protein [Phaeovulum sp.]|uniref:amidohydrolase family protein n=1 Tax=Phaeovulum sp. TaxID=2934796 RepID=UPI002730EDBC|nr:amidohydrolase family protein [Phaeovulum sp.]MDP1668404.1 amidohydrolase family protein [Phaeovulum sp.]MDP2013489.1 amidohydrolase family protein [Actinomycetota bacterium]MDZ4120101.1 amidohydrolase family protein [Phaeovulum sp.]